MDKVRQKEIAKLLTETLRDVSDYPKLFKHLVPTSTESNLIFCVKGY